jgi:hypothetical protein
MANCRACGGILGRDCFNEMECLEISRSENDMYNDSLYQNQEHYISVLIYTMEQKGIRVPNSFSAEPPLIMKILYGCENKYIDDGLPF